MALIKADGVNFLTADTYADLADARAYATKRGVALTAVDADLEANLIIAVDYIESFRDDFSGTRTNDTGLLQFPRTNLYIDDVLIDADTVPQLVLNCQSQLCIELHNSIDINPTSDAGEGYSIWEQVGPIIERRSEKIGAAQTPTMRKFESLLAPLLKQGSGAATVIRV